MSRFNVRKNAVLGAGVMGVQIAAHLVMGHTLGATGAIRAATVVHALRRGNLRYGMVTMCIGGGQGAAGILERV